jgi:hypothetical protein
MSAQTVSQMTIVELRHLIREMIEVQIQAYRNPDATRPLAEVNAEIRRLRWTPPDDAPSNGELLREDRDS